MGALQGRQEVRGRIQKRRRMCAHFVGSYGENRANIRGDETKKKTTSLCILLARTVNIFDGSYGKSRADRWRQKNNQDFNFLCPFQTSFCWYILYGKKKKPFFLHVSYD